MAEVTIVLKDTEGSVDINVEWGAPVEELNGNATPAQKLAGIIMGFLDNLEKVADSMDAGAEDDQPEAA